ncbi:hypothetical protein HU200_061707 [Digitaria exilis]|uniref:Uncharacterized protein n=1 Tax=Digitaria exilis TaxID=1010633 RepID=A0A835A4E4_9POAL|nr:hypothetical protein HU200_061707 [Digitaria exilis]
MVDHILEEASAWAAPPPVHSSSASPSVPRKENAQTDGEGAFRVCRRRKLVPVRHDANRSHERRNHNAVKNQPHRHASTPLRFRTGCAVVIERVAAAAVDAAFPNVPVAYNYKYPAPRPAPPTRPIDLSHREATRFPPSSTGWYACSTTGGVV